jgi:hypothetical protein
VFFHVSKSEVLVVEKDDAQFIDRDSETKENTQAGPKQTSLSWKPVADNYFLAEMSFTGRSGPQVNVNSVLESFWCFYEHIFHLICE